MEKPLLAYDKHINRQYPDLVDLEILGTSSAGNSTVIHPYNLIIDLGLPYKAYKNYLNNIKYVFLTHEHGDHLNLSTLKRIIEIHSYINIVLNERMLKIVNERLKEKYDLEIPDKRVILTEYDAMNFLETKDEDLFMVGVTKTPHAEIDNVAYTISGFTEIDGYTDPKILYCSDLSTIDPCEIDGRYFEGLPIEDDKYDIMLLEANYDEDKLREVIRKDPHNFRARQNERHLSESDAFRYVDKMLADDGIFIPLHASLEFGTFIQQ